MATKRQRPLSKAEIKRRQRNAVFLRIHKFFVSLAVLFILATVLWHFAIPFYLNMETAPTFATLSVEKFESSHYTRNDGVYNFLLVGSDDGHGNADTIMVVQYDSKGESLHLISVPRDTLVERSWSSFPKINASMSQGIETLKEEVSYTLGIPIDFYVHIGLESFIAVVDTLGGIDYNVPVDMYHDDEGGFVIDLQAGEQWLDGRHTLELVRYRGYATADIGRTETQQAVLKLLAQKLLSFSSLTKINDFLTIFEEYVNTDLSKEDFMWFGKQVLLHSDISIYTQTLEGRGDGVSGSTRWCYELYPDNTLETVNTYLNPYKTDRTLEDLTLKSADNYNS